MKAKAKKGKIAKISARHHQCVLIPTRHIYLSLGLIVSRLFSMSMAGSPRAAVLKAASQDRGGKAHLLLTQRACKRKRIRGVLKMYQI
jgi:hypothetical protein